MWTNWQFWKDATWRSFRTFCQTLAALLGGQAVNALTAPWASMLSVSATAALVSLLMSVDRERATTAAETLPANAARAGEQQKQPTQLTVDPVAFYDQQAVVTGCGDQLR